jgi:hypothetical protein
VIECQVIRLGDSNQTENSRKVSSADKSVKKSKQDEYEHLWREEGIQVFLTDLVCHGT